MTIGSHVAHTARHLAILTDPSLRAITRYRGRWNGIGCFGSVVADRDWSVSDHGLEDFFVLHEVFKLS
jgi:hypothetical protein